MDQSLKPRNGMQQHESKRKHKLFMGTYVNSEAEVAANKMSRVTEDLVSSLAKTLEISPVQH